MTPAWRGLSGLVEGQGNVTPDEEAYDPYPGAQGAAGKTLIPDGPDLRLHRAALQYHSTALDVTAGRQRIVLDNVRFIGDVAWRQNAQVFDALLVTAHPVPALDLTYAFAGRAIRIFGSEAVVTAQRRFEMRSHVVHATWRPMSSVTMAGYAYILGVTNSPADSSSTFGGFATGSRDVARTRLSGRVEYAHQVDNGHSPAGESFGLNYAMVEGRARLGAVTPVVGFESLGGNGRRGFGTPLATLHLFQGWADVFLTTPGDGVRDLYASGLFALPRAFALTAAFHRFTAARVSRTYGHELDVYLTRKLKARMTVGAKYAAYRGASGAPDSVRPDLDRLILDLNILWTHALRHR